MTGKQNTRVVFWGRMAAVLGVLPILILGSSGGPGPGFTAAPGEQSCAQAGCHVGTANPTTGGIELSVPSESTYTPGGPKQTWKVTVTGATGNIYGFSLSVRPTSNSNTQAGDLTATSANQEVLCQDGRNKPCNAVTPVQFVGHLMPQPGNEFTFDWTPPATDMGTIRVYVAANAANGNGQNTGDRIFTRTFDLTPAAAANPPTIRTDQPVLQAFLGGPRVSPGTWLEIYGSNFSAVTKDWSGLFTNNNTKAPTSIDDVSVNIDGKAATMFFLSPNQINVQVPDTIGLGTVQVEVVTPAGRASTTATATQVSPAMLTTPAFRVNNKQYIAALFQDFTTFVGPTGLISGANFRPAKPGDVVTVFTVGCGETNPASPSGEIVTGLRAVKATPRVTIGQADAQVQAFMAPNLIGLCQLNVTIPNTANGDNPIELTLDGTPTGQGLQITVQQ